MWLIKQQDSRYEAQSQSQESELPASCSSMRRENCKTSQQNGDMIDINLMSVSPCDFLPQQIIFLRAFWFCWSEFCMYDRRFDSLKPGHPIAVQKVVKI